MDHFVFIAKKDGTDFDDCTRDRETNRRNGIDLVGILPGGYAIHHRGECDNLLDALSQGQNVAVALRNLVAVCETIQVIDNQDVVFMIHFGGQDAATCRAFTRAMNETAAKDDTLLRHRFMAVSVNNGCPEGFFENGCLVVPPDTERINRVLELWSEGRSEVSPYDHLRGISLLCQKLQGMSDPEKKAKLAGNACWWRENLWKDQPQEKAHFSQAESELLKRNKELLLYDFCDELLENPGAYVDRLAEIIDESAKLLNGR